METNLPFTKVFDKNDVYCHELNKLTIKYPRKLISGSIPGWFFKSECRFLYLLTLVTDGPILEIGHFLGRSTSNICQALRDSGKKRLFDSYDLGFTTSEEYKKFYCSVHKQDITVPQEYEDFVYNKNTTTTKLARKNLNKYGLAKYVNLVSGNFIKFNKNKYDFILCDAMHEPNELLHNLRYIVRDSNKKCIWLFHDMTNKNIGVVLKNSKSLFVDSVDSLGVFIYKG